MPPFFHSNILSRKCSIHSLVITSETSLVLWSTSGGESVTHCPLNRLCNRSLPRHPSSDSSWPLNQIQDAAPIQDHLSMVFSLPNTLGSPSLAVSLDIQARQQQQQPVRLVYAGHGRPHTMDSEIYKMILSVSWGKTAWIFLHVMETI